MPGIGPAPVRESLAEALGAAHHRLVVLDQIVDGEDPQPEAIVVDAGRDRVLEWDQTHGPLLARSPRLPNLRGVKERDGSTDDRGAREDLRRRDRRPRRPRSRGARGRVLRPARSQRRRQDDADQLGLQPDPDDRRPDLGLRLRARLDGGAAPRRRRRAGPEPRPLPDRPRVARLPRRLLRDERRRLRPPGGRDDRRLRPPREGRTPGPRSSPAA